VNIGKGEQMRPSFLGSARTKDSRDRRPPTGRRERNRVSLFRVRRDPALPRRGKTGKFLPKQLIERFHVYEGLMGRWELCAPMPGQGNHFIALETEKDRAYGRNVHGRDATDYAVLDRRLPSANSRGPLSGRRLCHSALGMAAPRAQGLDLADFQPNVQRW